MCLYINRIQHRQNPGAEKTNPEVKHTGIPVIKNLHIHLLINKILSSNILLPISYNQYPQPISTT